MFTEINACHTFVLGYNLCSGRDKNIMNVYSVEMLGCHLLALLIHSHPKAFSAATVINLIDVVLFLPANPNLDKALQSDWATNPLQPISIGSQWTCHPFILHCSKGSWYLVSFLMWDSAIFSSHDTVNSHMITCFIIYETRIISGQSCVRIKRSGNLSCTSRSTNNAQSGAVLCSDVFTNRADRTFTPALRKLILLLTGLNEVHSISFQTFSCTGI